LRREVCTVLVAGDAGIGLGHMRPEPIDEVLSTDDDLASQGHEPLVPQVEG